MPNIFKKLSRGTNNLFKKIDNGASHFFNKLPSQVNNVTGQIKNGLNQGLDAVGGVAKQVSNGLEKYAKPLVSSLALGASMLAPEFSPAIMAASAAANKGLTSATNMSRAIQNGSQAGKAQVNQLAQTVNNKSNNVIRQAQSGLANGSANLQSQANNAIMGAQTATAGLTFH